jgi:endonuclease/exonuclease/phosphatase (EEP) superfamily protein YafD
MLCLLVVIFGTITVLTGFESVWQIADLASQGRLLYVAVFGLSALILGFFRSWKFATISLIFLLINFVPVWKAYWTPSHAIKTSGLSIRVLELNTWAENNDNCTASLNLINKDDPDVIGMVEVTHYWAQQMMERLPSYPYRVVEEANGGIALFSKYPLINPKTLSTENIKRPRLKADIVFHGQTIYVEVAHVVTPHQGRFKLRNSEFRQIAEETRSMHGTVILLGDLNCSPWSNNFVRLLSQGNLSDSEAGFTPQSTWSERFFFPLFPIDHILTSHNVITSVDGPPKK